MRGWTREKVAAPHQSRILESLHPSGVLLLLYPVNSVKYALFSMLFFYHLLRPCFTRIVSASQLFLLFLYFYFSLPLLYCITLNFFYLIINSCLFSISVFFRSSFIYLHIFMFLFTHFCYFTFSFFLCIFSSFSSSLLILSQFFFS